MSGLLKFLAVGRVVGAGDRAFELGQLVALGRDGDTSICILLELGEFFFQATAVRHGSVRPRGGGGDRCDL